MLFQFDVFGDTITRRPKEGCKSDPCQCASRRNSLLVEPTPTAPFPKSGRLRVGGPGDQLGKAVSLGDAGKKLWRAATLSSMSAPSLWSILKNWRISRRRLTFPRLPVE